MSLVAKPIIKNQWWVITDGHKKIGNVEASDAGGYSLKIGNNEQHFASTKSIEKMVHIEFERPKKMSPSEIKPYAVWKTEGKTYNDMYDVRRKLHLYTKTKSSKCYHAAGWFNIEMNGEWQTHFCPKYIFVQRYPYQGPFNNEHDAKSMDK